MKSIDKKPELLLHCCCAPCLASVYEQLKNDYEITLFWFNPNIHPFDEYIKRLEEVIKYAKIIDAPLIIEGSYADDHHSFIKLTQENSNEPEGGKRCEKCMAYRLMMTAYYAEKNGFGLFATTLSVSPHKNSKIISEDGNQVAEEFEEIKFLDKDFKKNDGYKKSIELCKKYNIYRQQYCGCNYSMNSNNQDTRNNKPIDVQS